MSAEYTPTIIYPEVEALRYLIAEQKKEIERLKSLALSCCCGGCTKHNLALVNNESNGEFKDE
jgi:hypothetical protein